MLVASWCEPCGKYYCYNNYYFFQCGKFEKKESDKPKRAQTAYFIFLGEFREQMKGKQSEGDQKIPALAGEKWRSMSEKDKEKYKQMEAVAKKKHEAAMEEWRKKVRERVCFNIEGRDVFLFWSWKVDEIISAKKIAIINFEFLKDFFIVKW